MNNQSVSSPALSTLHMTIPKGRTFLGWPHSMGLSSYFRYMNFFVSFQCHSFPTCWCYSPGCSGGMVGKGGGACNYVSGIWIPLSNPLLLPVDWAVGFPSIKREAETSANVSKCWKTRAKGNDVITNVISANQHFASTFSMKLSFLFPPRRQSAPESLLAG